MMHGLEVVVEFVAVVIYGTTFVMSTIGAILYWHAYRDMKRTRVIGAVALLLTAISVDTFWWMLTEFMRFIYRDTYVPWMVDPILLIFMKLILAAGVIHFVRSSVREETTAIEECAEKMKKDGNK